MANVVQPKPGYNQYIGMRYSPLPFKGPDGSNTWINTVEYEPLTVVMWEGNSYTSYGYVPIGVDISNKKYWVLTGEYNGQVASLGQRVDGLENEINELETTADQVLGVMDKKILVMGGVVRNTGEGWKFIEVQNHTPINMHTVTTNDNAIIITYDNPVDNTISFIVAPDETFATYGIMVGSSVNLTSITLNFASDMSLYTDGVTIPYVQPWFTNDLTIAANSSGSGFRIDHIHQSIQAPQVSIVRPINPYSYVNVVPTIAWGNNNIQIDCFSDLSGYVSFDGSVFNVSTANIGVTANYDDTGLITITHNYVRDSNSAVLSPRFISSVADMSYTPILASITNNTVSFYFYNNGTRVTTMDNRCACFIYRSCKVPTIMPTDFRANIFRANMHINPNNLVSDIGNIWILGVSDVTSQG